MTRKGEGGRDERARVKRSSAKGSVDAEGVEGEKKILAPRDPQGHFHQINSGTH